MRRFLLISALLLTAGAPLRAQFGNFADKPVEITAEGDTRFENGTAVADNNVQIRYGDLAIYADHAEYNPDTRDVLLLGNVRIYSGENLFSGQRAFYNLETKQVRALEFDGSHGPLKFSSLSAKGFGTRQFSLRESDITTSDSSMPDWHVHARTIRLYPGDRVVMLNSTLYVGKIPVFWLPYAFGNLRSQGFQIAPGYDSNWGGYLLTAYTFPLGTGDNFLATIRQDYRTLRGYAVGFDANLKFGKNDRSYGKFVSYYVNDQDPGQKTGGPGELPETASPSRYRIGYQGKMYLSDETYITFDMTKLSDRDFMQDFYPAENRFNPEPDNNVTLTKMGDFYTASLVTRWQMNNFQQTTTRQPEAAFDFKQEPLLGLPVYYDGTTALGQLGRKFSYQTNQFNQIGDNYSATRFDTFHQISAPQTLWGWLSTVPKIGIRGTFYSQGAYFQGTNGTGINTYPYSNVNQTTNTVAGIPPGNALHTTGSISRGIFNAGLENSFKISRSFEWMQSRLLGLDGLRHVFQPYSNLSYVYAGGPNVNQVPQFDRLLPNNPNQTTRSGYQPSSTQLEPLDFPQFGAIDSIDTWAIWRIGARNRLQTRRDGDTYDWFFVDTFIDVNGINPYQNGPLSNLNNRMTFAPVSWCNFLVGSQVPIGTDGFTELNTDFVVMPVRNFSFNFGTRYINNYAGYPSDNQYPFGAFWKVNDHWSISAQEIYNTPGTTTANNNNALIYQRYLIHRDLSSWIVSFGAEVRSNQGTATQSGQNQYGALITFTLKDLPQVTLPLAFSGARQAGSSPLSPSAQPSAQ